MATLMTIRSILHKSKAKPVGTITLENVWSWAFAMMEPDPDTEPAQALLNDNKLHEVCKFYPESLPVLLPLPDLI